MSQLISEVSPGSFIFERNNALLIDVCNEESLEMFWPEHLSNRSQDLPEAYHDAGQFYWGKPDSFLEQQPVFSSVSIPIVIPRHVTQDIDTPEDWVVAERNYLANQSLKI
jgi:pseudaminic acid cytidylyltransferase